MMVDGVETLIEGARAAAGLLESAVRVAVESAAVTWCAFLVAGEQDGQWQVVHVGGNGAPSAGTLLTAADLTALDERDPDNALYFRAATEQPGSAPRTGIVYARPAGAPENPQAEEASFSAVERQDPLHDALDGLFGHVQALLENLPGHSPEETPAPAGLMSEAQIRARLDEEVARARRYGGTVSVLLIDVDEIGSPQLESEMQRVGNVVSRQVRTIIAESLARSLRLMDCSGRHAADGFLVVLPETGAEEALRAGARFGRSVGQAIEEHVASLESGEAPAYELRCGVTTFPLAAQSTADLLEQAESALLATRSDPHAGWLRHSLAHLNQASASGRGFRCVCRHCGKVFEVDDRAHQRARRFCSHSCYVADRRDGERGRDESIRVARASGASLRELARQFSLSPERVRQICQLQPA